VLTKRRYIPHASTQLPQESTMKQAKAVILQQGWQLRFINNLTRLTMEHTWAVAAETKTSSGSFAQLEATACRCCVRI